MIGIHGSRAIAAAVLATSLTLACAACGAASPGKGASAAVDSTTPSPARATPSAAPATGLQTITSSAAGWFAGNEITLKGASYDPTAGTIVVSAEARNTSNHDFGFEDDVFLDIGSGTPLPLGGGVTPTALKLSTTGIGFTF